MSEENEEVTAEQPEEGMAWSKEVDDRWFHIEVYEEDGTVQKVEVPESIWNELEKESYGTNEYIAWQVSLCRKIETGVLDYVKELEKGKEEETDGE